MKLLDASALILSVALPTGVGFLGSLFGNGGDSEWYKQLKKPPWTPPNWAFPVVWTILYALMGVGAWRVWIHGGFEKQGIPLGVYLFQVEIRKLETGFTIELELSPFGPSKSSLECEVLGDITCQDALNGDLHNGGCSILWEASV